MLRIFCVCTAVCGVYVCTCCAHPLYRNLKHTLYNIIHMCTPSHDEQRFIMSVSFCNNTPKALLPRVVMRVRAQARERSRTINRTTQTHARTHTHTHSTLSARTRIYATPLAASSSSNRERPHHHHGARIHKYSTSMLKDESTTLGHVCIHSTRASFSMLWI